MEERSKSQSNPNKTPTRQQPRKQQMKKRKKEIPTFATKSGSKSLVILTSPY